MTHREQMLAAIRGESTDRLPWAPRLNLWRIAQEARGTLPKPLRGLDNAQLADALGVACHSVGMISPLTERTAEDFALRGLGIEQHADNPFRVEVRGLPHTFRREGDLLHTVIKTPAGDVTTVQEYSGEMKREGISIAYQKKFPIVSMDDFEAVAQVFEHLCVIPAPEAYAAFRRRLGERGLAVASGLMGASPMHFILHDLMPQEEFFYLYADERDGLKALAKRLEPFFHDVLSAVTACDAEVIQWGQNFDQHITWPAFFEGEIAPWLQGLSGRLHAKGKRLLVHADGEDQKLLALYPSCGFDVAESVCPHPMTRCTLKEIREGMGPKVTVWGGLCSIAFLKDSMSDAAFEAYLDGIFGELGAGERLILGVSDMVPVDADLGRLERVKERIEAFGPIRAANSPS